MMSQAFKSWWQEIRSREWHDARCDRETAERIAMCVARKADQLRLARDAGLLDDDPLVAVLMEWAKE
jgi:hypothetical protein